MNQLIEAEKILARAEEMLLAQDHTDLEHANVHALHRAISGACMEAISLNWVRTEKENEGKRQAAYISAEYLVGRMVFNNLFCMGILRDVDGLLEKRGVRLSSLEDIEDDAFGNGGLGRLAACFLDSSSTLNLPLTGYGLRYRYGLFKQSFVDGRQHEEPDDWSRFGDPWSIRREDEAIIVRMKTGDVLAVPYDMPVIGYETSHVGTLRLWQCESLHEIDFPLFNDQAYAKASADKNRAEDITKFLYPNDTRREGKQLRVKQQYVMVSASIQDMLRRYRLRHGNDYSRFADEYAVQLNDTHPVMAIPELIRLLTENGMTFENAFEIAKNTFAYTNHTVMQEALEKWDLSLLSSVCPDIVAVIRRIDQMFRKEMKEKGQTVDPNLCIIEGRRVHMAQLAVYATFATNGVAQIHSELLKRTIFSKWYSLYPERFQNKTNGITQRRWLGLCNPELCRFISDRIGDGYLTDLNRLEELKNHLDDASIHAFQQVKLQKKQRLSEEIMKLTGIEVPPTMIFDVQVKRLHEYKRQLMNALSLLAIYHGLKSGDIREFTPTAFIFGAKAAPGYDRAKAVIHLINLIADTVNADPDVNDRMKVVFLPNYNCSLAELIMPAADISEQISPAGTEASGTGNMKLMLNGAVTLGTFDGANVEIVEQAGEENNYIFGATVEELDRIRDTYDPRKIYRKNAAVARVLNDLVNGTFPDEDGAFHELYTSLLDGASWHKPDHYFILKDFDSYMEARLRANRDYARDPDGFARKCLINVAMAGKFSSDRTIAQYAEEIWKIRAY